MVGVMITDGGAEFDPPPATEEIVLDKSYTDIAAEVRDLPLVRRAMVAATLKTRGGGGDTRSRRAQERGVLIPANPYPSLSELAAMFEVAVSTVRRVKIVMERGAPELVEALQEGLVQPYLAGRLTENVTREQQVAFVDAVRRGHSPKTLGRRMFDEDPYTVARREREQAGSTRQRRPAKPAAGQHVTAGEVAQVRHTLDALGHVVRASDGLDPSITSEQAAQILDGLSKGRGALRRVIQLLTQRKESTQP